MATFSVQPDGASGIDARLNSGAATTNYGSLNVMVVGETVTDTTNYQSIGIIKFDLSSIPSTAIVTSASLYLTHVSKDASQTRTMYVLRCLRDWTEAGVTWNKYDGVNNWGTSGGLNTSTDIDVVNVWGSRSISSSEADGEKEWTLSITEMQKFINGTYSNYGWFLTYNMTQFNDYHQWASSDHATSSYRPRLVIEYTIPSGGSQAIWWS